MKTISITGQKGGVAKTTLAIHLAENLRRVLKAQVSILDRDPQQGCAGWASKLGFPGGDLTLPLGENIRRRKKAGDAFCIVDTAPTLGGAFRDIPTVSDLIILPTRSSLLDISALGNSLKQLRESGVKVPVYAVLTQVDSRLRVVREAVAALDAARIPQLGVKIGKSTGYEQAANLGATYDHPDIDAFCREIRNLLGI